LSSQLQAWQQAQYDKQQLEQKLQQKINEFTLPIQQTSARLEELGRQEQETQKIIEQAGDIQAGLEKLNYHRQRLQELDRLALKYAPLNSRKADLNMQLEREKARIKCSSGTTAKKSATIRDRNRSYSCTKRGSSQFSQTN
jgi:exonuclease SbcC